MMSSLEFETKQACAQLTTLRQESLTNFLSFGGVTSTTRNTTSIQSVRFCKDPYTLSHPLYATCGRIRLDKPGHTLQKCVMQVALSRTTQLASIPCPVNYRGRESNQGINVITMDTAGNFLVVASRSGFVRIYDGHEIVNAMYDR